MAGFLEILEDAMERRRKQPYVDALMLSSALIAIADGKVSMKERHSLDEVISTLKDLKPYTPKEMADIFYTFIATYEDDRDQGRERVIAAVRAIAHDKQAARDLMTVCYAISQADGVVDKREEQVMALIMKALGASPFEQRA